MRLLRSDPQRVASGPAPAFVGPNFCGNHAAAASPQIALPPGWMPDWCPRVRGQSRVRGRARERRLKAVAAGAHRRSRLRGGDVLLPATSTPTATTSPTACTRATSAPGQLCARPARLGHHRRLGLGPVASGRLPRDRLRHRRPSASPSSATRAWERPPSLAGAFDERIAAIFPHQAGCGGTAPSRGKAGESVKQINDTFPHWFCGQFKAFNERPELLPFDQHCLAALVAPRPLLFSERRPGGPVGQPRRASSRSSRRPTRCIASWARSGLDASPTCRPSASLWTVAWATSSARASTPRARPTGISS